MGASEVAAVVPGRCGCGCEDAGAEGDVAAAASVTAVGTVEAPNSQAIVLRNCRRGKNISVTFRLRGLR
jgi:hypothetical protein